MCPSSRPQRDPRLITVRRGGTLTDDDHRLLADWALRCAEHVLHLFEDEHPDDTRPRDALAIGHAWIRGEVPMKTAHAAAFQANAAARGLPDPAKFAALSAGQAVAVAHVAAHDLGAAAYAIRAVGCRRAAHRAGLAARRSCPPPSVSSSSTTSASAAPSAGTSSTTDPHTRRRRPASLCRSPHAPS